MQVYINGLYSKSLSVEIPYDYTVGNLKEKISSLSKIPANWFSLSFWGKPLDFSKLVTSYNIAQGSAVTFSIGLRGGGCGSSNNKDIKDTVRVVPEMKFANSVNQNIQVSNQSMRKRDDSAKDALVKIESGLTKGDDLEVIQGLTMLKDANFKEIEDAIEVSNRMIDCLCHKYTEGFPQIRLEKLAEKLPHILALILYKEQTVSKETKDSFIARLDSKEKLVKEDRLGGPELGFYLRTAIKFAKVLPTPFEVDVNGIKNFLSNAVKLMNFFADPGGTAEALAYFAVSGFNLISN